MIEVSKNGVALAGERGLEPETLKPAPRIPKRPNAEDSATDVLEVSEVVEMGFDEAAANRALDKTGLAGCLRALMGVLGVLVWLLHTQMFLCDAATWDLLSSFGCKALGFEGVGFWRFSGFRVFGVRALGQGFRVSRVQGLGFFVRVFAFHGLSLHGFWGL